MKLKMITTPELHIHFWPAKKEDLQKLLEKVPEAQAQVLMEAYNDFSAYYIWRPESEVTLTRYDQPTRTTHPEDGLEGQIIVPDSIYELAELMEKDTALVSVESKFGDLRENKPLVAGKLIKTAEENKYILAGINRQRGTGFLSQGKIV